MGEVAPLFPKAEPIEPDPILVVEQALLGGMMMHAVRALQLLPPSFSSMHYLDPLHRDIHDAIAALECGEPDLVNRAVTAAADDRAYVMQLITAGISPGDTPAYAKAVSEGYHRRAVVEIAKQMLTNAESGTKDMPAADIATHALGRLDMVLSGTQHYGVGRSFDGALDATLDAASRAARGESILGRSTGMASVDAVLGGLENGCFYVLAARPGMGKSALGSKWAVNVANACRTALDERGERAGVGIFSLEMSATAIARRVLSDVSRISIQDIKRGAIDTRMIRLTQARQTLGGLPLWIEDAGGQNLIAIRQKARSMRRKFGSLAMIVVDHLHIVKPEENDRRSGPTQAIGRISNALRDLSKDFECPVLALAQLSRGLLAREDKRPNLGDLRQAGDIEQDADAVMFVHREEALLPKSATPRGPTELEAKYQERVSTFNALRDRVRGKADLICEKVRDGEPQIVPLLFDGPTTTFSEPNRPDPTAQGNLADWHDAYDDGYRGPA